MSEFLKCVVCGVEFSPSQFHPHQKFCSDNCRETQHRKRFGGEFREKVINEVKKFTAIPVGISQILDFWTANLRVSGKQFRRSFSIKKYGNHQALQLAIEAREKLISEFRKTLIKEFQIRCHNCREEIEWCGFGRKPEFCSNKCRQASFWNSYKDVTGLNYRNRHGGLPQPAPYERPDIPDEFETEIPLLLNKWNAVPLDHSGVDREDGNHSFFASDWMTPLEILMMKEEMESIEHEQRQNDILQWNRYQTQLNPVHV